MSNIQKKQVEFNKLVENREHCECT